MNWHVNGRASMPCDAPISVDLNTQTPPRNSPSLLPLMHQHRLKLAMARLLLNLSQYSGSRNPQANVIDFNFPRLGKPANFKTLPHYPAIEAILKVVTQHYIYESDKQTHVRFDFRK